MKNTFDILKERGFVADCTDENALRKAFGEKQVTAYVGYDPTGESLHVGNLLSMIMLRHLILGGHRAIGVIGGGTSLIGDPSGKDEMRKLLTRETIRANFEKIKSQVVNFLTVSGCEPPIIVDNADWLEKLEYIPFLRDIGRHFSVNRMLAAEAYKIRLEKGLSFLEFNYQILQAYDFLQLFRRHGCTLQMGGSDQWGNIVAGVDLIRRVEGAEAHALTCPLLTTAGGGKMGKTEKGAVWLDGAMFSPYEFYQFWRNTDDRDVARMLKYYTFVPMEEIAVAEKAQGSELNKWKDRLANEVTALVHGAAEAVKTTAASVAIFSGASTGTEVVPTVEVTADEIAAGYWIATAALKAGLVSSKGEAGRLAKQGGLYLNDEPVNAPDFKLTAEHFIDGAATIRAGKKKYARIVLKK
jgi:tyrosyl-tRNA synthetase